MEKTFYYSYRKEAFQSIMCACLIGISGAVTHFLFKLMTLPYFFIVIAYYLYAASLFLVFISIWFSLRPNKKYIVLTESKIEIIGEKNRIDISRSQISSLELCQSPIEWLVQPRFGQLSLRDASTALKLSLKSAYLQESIDYKYYKSDIENYSSGSQFVYIGDDKKQIYLRLAPVGGFEPLVQAFNDKV